MVVSLLPFFPFFFPFPISPCQALKSPSGSHWVHQWYSRLRTALVTPLVTLPGVLTGTEFIRSAFPACLGRAGPFLSPAPGRRVFLDTTLSFFLPSVHYLSQHLAPLWLFFSLIIPGPPRYCAFGVFR